MPVSLVTPEGENYSIDVYIDEGLRIWVKLEEAIKILSLGDIKELGEKYPTHIRPWKSLKLAYLTSPIPLCRQLPKIVYDLETLFINESGMHKIILEFKRGSELENWFVDNISLKVREGEVYNSIKTTLNISALKTRLAETRDLCGLRGDKILFALQFSRAREQYLKAITKQIESLNKQIALLKDFSLIDSEDKDLLSMVVFDKEDYDFFAHFDTPTYDLAMSLSEIGKQKIYELFKNNSAFPDKNFENIL